MILMKKLLIFMKKYRGKESEIGRIGDGGICEDLRYLREIKRMSR